MTSHCDNLVEALYRLFTTQLAFPAHFEERYYQSLCDLGYAEVVAQGHATGYRITTDGHKVATARWGYVQR